MRLLTRKRNYPSSSIEDPEIDEKNVSIIKTGVFTLYTTKRIGLIRTHDQTTGIVVAKLDGTLEILLNEGSDHYQETWDYIANEILIKTDDFDATVYPLSVKDFQFHLIKVVKEDL